MAATRTSIGASGTRAARYWASSAVRRRRSATLAVALLVAVASAVPMAAATAVRRTATVVERVSAQLRIPDVELQIEEIDDEQVDTIREALPGVRLVGHYAVVFVRPSGTDLIPFGDFFALGSVDGVWGYEMMRPRLDAGRLPDPGVVDEVLVTRPVAERLSLEPGDRFSVDTLTMEAVIASFETGGIPQPDGPVIEVVVTGVGEVAQETVAKSQIPNGTMLFTPAFLQRYPEVAAFRDLVDVALDGGRDAVPEFVSEVRRVIGTEVFVTPVEQQVRQLEGSVGVQHTALLLLFAVAGVAALVAVVQVAARTAGRHRRDLEILDALGLPVRHRVLALAMVAAPAAVIGAVAGAVGSVFVSPLLSFGTARRLEPDRALPPSWAVLVIGSVVTVVAAVGAVVVATALAERRRRVPAVRGGRPWIGAVVDPLAAALAIGVRWAYIRGRGRSSTPMRSALAGAAFAVAGVVGAMVFAGSVDRLLTTPERYGVTFELDAGLVGDEASDEEALGATDALAQRDEVSAVSYVRIAKVDLGGETRDAFGLQKVRGDIGYAVIEGRAPAAQDEAVAGTELLRDLHLSVGDPLYLTDGSPPVRIVGRAVFPPLDDGDSLATAIGFTREGLAAALDVIGDEDSSSGYPQVLVRVAPGVDAEDLREQYVEEFGFAETDRVPTSVANLSESKNVPGVLAAFLGLLGLLALAHAILVAASRRRLDLAILRCLGFRRRDLAVTAATHTLAVIAFGVIVGLPVGAVVGTWAWRIVAADVGVATDPAGVARALLVATAGAMVIGIAVAIPWARSAARTSAGRTLRTE